MFSTVAELITTEALKGAIDESLHLQPKWANVNVIWVGRTKKVRTIILSFPLTFHTCVDVVFTELTQVIIEDYSPAVIEGSMGPYRVKYGVI